MAILLIRHGETPGNRDRIIQFPHTPLSERGLEQAARLGQRLATVASSIHSSSTMRCWILPRSALTKPSSSSPAMASSICSAVTRWNGPLISIERIGRSSILALAK